MHRQCELWWWRLYREIVHYRRRLSRDQRRPVRTGGRALRFGCAVPDHTGDLLDGERSTVVAATVQRRHAGLGGRHVPNKRRMQQPAQCRLLGKFRMPRKARHMHQQRLDVPKRHELQRRDVLYKAG